MNLKISDIEKKLDIKLLLHQKSFGFDGAGRTGWCIAKTGKKILNLNYGFIDARKVKLPDRYKIINETFSDIIKQDHRVMIEEVYGGRNFKTPIILARIGIIAYIIASNKGCSYIKFLTAGQARAKIGVKGNAKKVDAQKQFKDLTKIKLNDDDIVDAIILAICGLIDEN